MERIAAGLEAHSAALRKVWAELLSDSPLAETTQGSLLNSFDEVSNARAWSELIGEPILGDLIADYFKDGWLLGRLTIGRPRHRL